MWLLFGICIIVVTTESADTNGDRYKNYLATNWERIEENKFPDAFKLPPRKLIILSTPYNSKMPQWNKILQEQISERDVEKRNKIIENGESKYQMTQIRSPESSSSEWLMATNINNSKERRNPAFSPWGGKRNSSPYKADLKIRRPSRVPFNSWGGKRNSENNSNEKNSENIKQNAPVNFSEIKKPFNSWGGKRTPVLIEYMVHYPSDNGLKNIWRFAHATPINEHTNQDSFSENEQNNEKNDVEEQKNRLRFEPWDGKQSNVDMNKNDLTVLSAPTLRYTQ